MIVSPETQNKLSSDPMDEFVLVGPAQAFRLVEWHSGQSLTLHLRGAAAYANVTIERTFDSGIVVCECSICGAMP